MSNPILPNNRWLVYPAILILTIALSGCAHWFGDRGKFRERALDYQQAQTLDPLVMPPGLESIPTQQRYPIPDIAPGDYYQPETSRSAPRPASLLNINEYAGIALRKNEQGQWLELSVGEGIALNRVVAFLQDSDIPTSRIDQGSGVVETQWLPPLKVKRKRSFWRWLAHQFRDPNKNRAEKFLFTVTPGAGNLAEGAEIRIQQTKRKSPAADSQVAWPVKNQDQLVLEAMYDQLMDYFSEQGKLVGSVVLSKDVSALPEYTMTWDGNGFPILVINRDFNQAWQQVGLALKRATLPVLDIDRSLGVYYLSAKNLKVAGYDADDGAKDVQVRLANSESGVQVSVQLDDETVAPKPLATAILNRLREHLE